MLHQKECFKCKEIKPLEEFYQHGRMASQRLNKCKECTKADVRLNRAKKLEQYRQYDRGRAMRPDRVEARLEYRKTEQGKQVKRKADEKYYQRCPEKYKARVTLNNAVRDGKISKPSTCACGRSGRIEAHHEDYSKPLEVSWLCVPCHKQAHK